MKRKLETMTTDIKEIYEYLKIEVLWLHGRWKIYRQLFMFSVQRIDLLNECAGGVFNILKFAQLDDVILTLCRLTDPIKSAGKETISLLRLIKTMEQNKRKEITSNLETLFEELEGKCIPFREHRNHRIAHKDLLTARKISLEPLPGISVEKIEDALSKLREFMEKFESYFVEFTPAYNNVDMGFDGETLICVLKQAVKYRELEYNGVIPKDQWMKCKYKEA